MKSYFYLNPSKMLELSKELTGGEIKMLLAIMYCIAGSETTLFFNNKENRAKMEDIDFKRSPERICSLLSSLVSHGAIKREANAVYSLPKDLFLLPDQIEEIIPL